MGAQKMTASCHSQGTDADVPIEEDITAGSLKMTVYCYSKTNHEDVPSLMQRNQYTPFLVH